MSEYAVDLPYPNINHLDRNSKYGEMILSDIGGLHSKMNLISLYFYNSIIFKDNHELSQIMEGILKIKLIHLKILSQMTFLLGVDPRLWNIQNDTFEYWSPGYNIYPKHIHSAIENIILQEENTISILYHQTNIIKEPIISNMLKRMILDDQLHVEILQNYLSHMYKTE